MNIITSIHASVVKRFAIFTTLTLIAAVFALSSAAYFIPTSSSAYATSPKLQTVYPWSRVPGTGDYIADKYFGVSKGHVFENVTTDRLLDILSSNGNYYIVFAGPEHDTAQALLPIIQERAAAAGISKIYHFDPYLDGYQLDITDSGGYADWTGGISVNYGGTAKAGEVLRLIKDLLPPSAADPGGALYGYKGDTAMLLSVSISNRTAAANSGKKVNGFFALRADQLASFGASSKAAARSAINSLFRKGSGGSIIKSDARSDYEFFKRLYGASATAFNLGTPSSYRTGSAETIFSDKDFPGGKGFVLHSIDIKELYNLLNSPGEFPILFAGQGCHNTQAIIGKIALKAKERKIPIVYVVDFALNSNVKFGKGADIDKAAALSSISATGGLWVRASATASSNRYSYLYGELAGYLTGLVTENESDRTTSIAYYPNGNWQGAPTTDPFIAGYDGTSPRNAPRLQVPFLLRYNKDAKKGPVTAQWIHRNSDGGGFTEYMLELAWVKETPEALAAVAARYDGLSAVQFAREAVAALDNVLVTPTDNSSSTPTGESETGSNTSKNTKGKAGSTGKTSSGNGSSATNSDGASNSSTSSGSTGKTSKVDSAASTHSNTSTGGSTGDSANTESRDAAKRIPAARRLLGSVVPPSLLPTPSPANTNANANTDAATLSFETAEASGGETAAADGGIYDGGFAGTGAIPTATADSPAKSGWETSGTLVLLILGVALLLGLATLAGAAVISRLRSRLGKGV